VLPLHSKGSRELYEKTKLRNDYSFIANSSKSYIWDSDSLSVKKAEEAKRPMQEIDGLLKWRFTKSSAQYCLLKRRMCSGIYRQKVTV
jgi:hypothetical protein